MKCKQTLECERTYFYQALFASSSRFPGQPRPCSSSQPPEVRGGRRAAAANKGEGRGAERLELPPRRRGRVKSLHEMPGPNTLYNLYEFFWKDGFGRIHEIQVQLPRVLRALIPPGLLKPFLSSPGKAPVNRRASRPAAGHRCPAFLQGRAGFRGSPAPVPAAPEAPQFCFAGDPTIPAPRRPRALLRIFVRVLNRWGGASSSKKEKKTQQNPLFFFFFFSNWAVSQAYRGLIFAGQG